MVKLFRSACGNIESDGYIKHRLGFLPDTVTVDAPESADVILIDWTWRKDYVPNHQLIERILHSGKPVVVFDYLECGQDSTMFMTRPTNWNTSLAPYGALHVLEPAIRAYFKREYIKADVLPGLPYPVYPSDFISETFNLPEQPEPPETFAKRPIDIFMVWGYSSVERPLLHAELLKRHFRNLATTMEDVKYLVKEGRTGIAALMFTPHYRRVAIQEVLYYQGMAKLSICLRGASQKCFRHGESPLNSVMAMQECTTEFAFPWVDKVNCIVLPNLPQPNINPPYRLDITAACTAISMALGNPNLYEIYKGSVYNGKNYLVENYIQRHWLPIMRRHGAWPY